MAITPDVTTVTVDGVTIGLSDTIANLITNGDFTIDNLTPYMFCGQSTVGNVKYNSLSGAERTYNGSGGSLPDYYPVYNTGSVGDVTVEYANRESPLLSQESYGRNILIHGSLGIGGEPQSIRSDNMSASDMRVVTSINFKKIYYDVEMGAQTLNYDYPAGSATYYTSGGMGRVRTIDNDEDTGCFVYSLFGDSSDWYCVKDWMFPASDYANNLWQFSSFQTMSGNFGNTYASILYGFTNFTNDKAMSRAVASTSGDVYGGGSFPWTVPGLVAVVDGDHISVCDYSPYSGTCRFYLSGLDNALLQVANAGLKFKWNNTWYKPIGEGGYITGYTDDMTEESDWDDIVDVTGNIVPVTPPGPTPPTPSDDDDYANMGVGVGTNVGGLTNYAIMSIRDLATLLADFNEHLETGMSIQNNFVCLYKLGPLSSFLCNTSVRAIVMSANGENNFVSVDDYSVVSGQKAQHYFGSYDVPRFTNTFYDFSPYSTYELFIPCCGWVPLPDTVAGRTIDVYLVFDLASCTCKGIARIKGTTVAEVSGVLGSSVPFYMIEHGMERLAQVTAITQTLSSLVVGGVGAASGNAGVAAYGLSQLTQSLNDLNVAGNTNFTAIKGGNGDMSAMGNGEYCTIKITHPVVDSVVDNSMFGHSVGYLCNTIGKLSTFKGFTVCGNPHVTFSASAEEREEIERLLSMGVIL